MQDSALGIVEKFRYFYNMASGMVPDLKSPPGAWGSESNSYQNYFGDGGIGHHSSDLSFYQMMLINCLVFC